MSLAEQYAGEEIKVNDKVMVSRQQSLGDYMSNYSAIHKEQLAILYTQEKAEKESTLLKLQFAKAELTATRLQIELQYELIKAIQAGANAASGTNLNTDKVKAQLAEVDRIIQTYTKQENKIKLDIQVDKEKYDERLRELDTEAQQWKTGVETKAQPILTVTLKENTEPATKDHRYWLDWVARQKAETALWLKTQNAEQEVKTFNTKIERHEQPVVNLKTDTTTAKSEIDTFTDSESHKTVNLPVAADTQPAERDTKEFQDKVDNAAPAYQDVWADMNAAYTAVEDFKLTTASAQVSIPVHADVQNAVNEVTKLVQWIQRQRPILTVTQRVIQSRASGGPIFSGTGRVPGYDASEGDRLLASLTAGEHDINRSAADSIGRDVLEYMNRFKRLPGYATGGMVKTANTTAEFTPQPVVLNIGTQQFDLTADRTVAESLQRYIETEGGL
jgi:hypothetical protein